MKTVNIPASGEFDMTRKTQVLEIEVKIFWNEFGQLTYSL